MTPLKIREVQGLPPCSKAHNTVLKHACHTLDRQQAAIALADVQMKLHAEGAHAWLICACHMCADISSHVVIHSSQHHMQVLWSACPRTTHRSPL
jgi:hypothetical protein